MPGGRITPGATAWPPPSKRRGKWSSSGILVVREAETAVRARRRREEAVLPVPRGPARSMGVQKAAPSAPACSRWGLLASDDASVPTAASDRSGAARKGLDAISLKKNSGCPKIAAWRQVLPREACRGERCIALTLRKRDA